MEFKAISGILSAVFTLVGATFYLNAIYRKESNPHLLSWFGWAFITFVGSLAMLDSGSTWSVLFIFSNFLSCISIAIYAIYKKVGYGAPLFTIIYFSY